MRKCGRFAASLRNVGSVLGLPYRGGSGCAHHLPSPVQGTESELGEVPPPGPDESAT